MPRCALDAARDKARESCWHWPHRGTSGELLGQRSNQAQEFLLLWSVASRDEKGSDLNVRDLSTGGKIRLMPDKRPTGFRIAGEQPPIPLGTAVNLSRPNSHPEFCSMLYPLQVRSARGPLGDSPRGLFLLAFELLDKCSKTRGMGATRDPRIHAPTSPRYQRRQMINASNSIMPIPITSTASATGS